MNSELSVAELSSLIETPVATIYYWIKNNKIPYKKVLGLIVFDKSHVDFIKANKNNLWYMGEYDEKTS